MWADTSRGGSSLAVRARRSATRGAAAGQRQGQAARHCAVSSAEAATAAYNSFQSGSNTANAVLDLRRTRLHNTLVDLAIQIQRVAWGECGWGDVAARCKRHTRDVRIRNCIPYICYIRPTLMCLRPRKLITTTSETRGFLHNRLQELAL